MKNNQLMIKSEELSLQVIKIRKFLEKNGEYVLSNQLVKSGTSVGANICEAIDSFSKNEFYYKITLALKEARETNYWLKIIFKSGYISNEMYQTANNYCLECMRMLISTKKKVKSQLDKEN